MLRRAGVLNVEKDKCDIPSSSRVLGNFENSKSGPLIPIPSSGSPRADFHFLYQFYEPTSHVKIGIPVMQPLTSND